MKKRILGIILTICMVLTLIPISELVKAEDNKNYSYYYVLGSNLINNGAGDERKPENRMIEVEPNVYELTAINVKKCEKQSFVFDNGTHY